MLSGINTNVGYRGRIYHIQTEDGGIDNPVIITQVFEGGAIISTLKSDYRDLIGLEDLAAKAQDRMKQQHRTMLKELYAGRFDKGKDRVEGNRSGVDRKEGRGQESEIRRNDKPIDKKDTLKEERINLDEVILNYLTEVEEE